MCYQTQNNLSKVFAILNKHKTTIRINKIENDIIEGTKFSDLAKELSELIKTK